jgi:hypothetical protein
MKAGLLAFMALLTSAALSQPPRTSEMETVAAPTTAVARPNITPSAGTNIILHRVEYGRKKLNDTNNRCWLYWNYVIPPGATAPRDAFIDPRWLKCGYEWLGDEAECGFFVTFKGVSFTLEIWQPHTGQHFAKPYPAVTVLCSQRGFAYVWLDLRDRHAFPYVAAGVRTRWVVHVKVIRKWSRDWFGSIPYLRSNRAITL